VYFVGIFILICWCCW